ncbi:hypothetical protein B0H10DRAFT_2388381 [Mycena sp. CBHHK59/15]|nr:hypothetical protein B0H10DRAFT_2388381 [Mycena sp. CBHHK59/15]
MNRRRATDAYGKRSRVIPPQCRALRAPLPLGGDPQLTALRARQGSGHYVPGTRPGANNGKDIVYGGDVFLDKGVIVAIGEIPPQLKNLENLETVNVHGKWVRPGIVDAHSHLGVGSAPGLSGASDSNSHKAPILPWLRSIDGINTHDMAYRLTMSGGVTTAQIVPSSANNIGGQSFLVKLRPTVERSPSSMLLEPPHTLFLDASNSDTRRRWRENTMHVHSQTCMDAAWNLRQAYNEASKIKNAQDAFCDAAENTYPESLQWEALVDVLRGHVKLSNEFNFPIASIHHATSTYLVPDLLKQAWVSLATSADSRPKRETYRTSEFAARILSDHGLSVVIKSDHSVTNSRFLMFEAQQAHYYSLDPAIALSSVTTNAAAALGVDWWIGKIAEDLVIWDSHPLALGPIPVQVYIDGIPQIEHPMTSLKPESAQRAPKTPEWEREINETLRFDGLPHLEGRRNTGIVRFVGVKGVWTRGAQGIQQLLTGPSILQVPLLFGMERLFVLATTLPVSCLGSDRGDEEIIDLKGGSLAPGLTSFGSNLGLSEITQEPSTMDGPHSGYTVIRAVDGLQFGGRHSLLAYRSGVTTGITAPMSRWFLQGVATAFDVGVGVGLEPGAIVQAETALHVSISLTMSTSVSTQIATLRRLLFDENTEDDPWRCGEIPLVVSVHNADIMASRLRFKAEYETNAIQNRSLRMTFAGALEAHLLAREIGKAGVNVILTPARPFPRTWEMRSISGQPSSQETAFTVLFKNGVNVGMGIVNEYDARNARFDMAMVALKSDSNINNAQVLARASTNIELALRLEEIWTGMDELVAYRGGEIFDMESKVVGVVSARRAAVELF